MTLQQSFIIGETEILIQVDYSNFIISKNNKTFLKFIILKIS